MIKPLILKEYYLSPNEVRAIAETTLTLYMSNMLRKRNMISESEHNMVLDECAHRLTPTLLAEGNTYGSRKRIYTTEQYINELKRNFNEIMLNENIFGDIWDGVKSVGKGAWNGIKKGVGAVGDAIGSGLEKVGMWKKGDGFGRNMARVFGFNPDEGLSWGNILNGAIHLGSLVAAPFTGGGSLAAGTAARMALGAGARAAGTALARGALGAGLKTGLKTLGTAGLKSLAKGTLSNAARGVGKNMLWNAGINGGMNLLGAAMGANGEQQGEQPQYGTEQYAQMGQGGQNPYAMYAQNPYAMNTQNPYTAQVQSLYGGGMQSPYGGNDIYGLSGYGGYGGGNPYAAYYGMA